MNSQHLPLQMNTKFIFLISYIILDMDFLGHQFRSFDKLKKPYIHKLNQSNFKYIQFVHLKSIKTLYCISFTYF